MTQEEMEDEYYWKAIGVQDFSLDCASPPSKEDVKTKKSTSPSVFSLQNQGENNHFVNKRKGKIRA